MKFLAVLIFTLSLCAIPLNGYARDPAYPKHSFAKSKQLGSASASNIYRARFGPSDESLSPTAAETDKQNVPAPSNLPRVKIARDGPHLMLDRWPNLNGRLLSRYAASADGENYLVYTIDSALQQFMAQIIGSSRAQHVAAVMIDPLNGKVLAAAQHSESVDNMLTHDELPAASIFKLVTTAAASEHAGLGGLSRIFFRGGNYTLNEWNYLPDRRRDRRNMTLAEALGRSCNPVFARVGLNYLTKPILASYARAFGFNTDLQFDTPLPRSQASIPFDDYGFSRTAAGFGEVRLTPIHAAAIAAGLANGGRMLRPHIIDKIVAPDGKVLYQNHPEILQTMVRPETAAKLLGMMEFTTTIGTSHREFYPNRHAALPGIRVAAKTGTLKGDNPAGITNWFVGLAPIENPAIALAVVVVNPVNRLEKASHLGRVLLQRFFAFDPTPEPKLRRPAKKYYKKKFSKPKAVKRAPIKKIASKKISSKKIKPKKISAKKTKSRGSH